MRLTNHFQCSNCSEKCDIYKANALNNNGPFQLKSIRGTYRKRDLICKQGTKVSHAMYVLKGKAKMLIEGHHRKNIILNIIGPGNYIGLLSYFEPVDYCYTVIALEDMEICLLEIQTIKELYQSDHHLFTTLNQALSHASVSIMKKIISLNQKTIRARLAECLLYLSGLNGHDSINLNLTRKELGEMCGMSEENIVRLLKNFREEKIIQIEGRKVDFLNKSILTRISENG